jgi:DNA-binding NtrC family response regulator
LLVDDDTRSVRVLARMLREDGFDVEVVFDGASAIARLGRDPVPCMLVTDNTLPHVDGNSIAKYARWRRPGIPLVFITGYPHLLEAFDAPVIVHTKPVAYDALARQLEAFAMV